MNRRSRSIAVPNYQPLESRRLLAPLANGQELEASLAVGSTEAFEFVVAADGPVRVAVGELRGDRLAEPTLEILDADGNQVVVDSNPSEDSAAVSFSAVAGSYTAVIGDADNDEAMDFRVRAISLADDVELLARQDRVLQNGEEYDTQLHLGTFAVFPFEVSAPGVTRFSAANFFFPIGGEQLSVYSPAGQLIGTDWSSSLRDGSVVQFDATVTGTYTAVVNDLDYDRDMLFRVRVVSQAAPVTSSTEADVQLVNGVEVDTLVLPGSFAVAEVPVDSPGTLVVYMRTQTTFSMRPDFVLFDAAGDIVDPAILPKESPFSTPSMFVYELDADQVGATGSLTGWVGRDTEAGVSHLKIRSVFLPGDVALTDGRDGVLEFGSSVSAMLDGTETFSLFQLPVAELSTTRVSVVGGGAEQWTPDVFLFDPQGRLMSRLGEDFGVSTVDLLFAPPMIGTYTVMVRHAFPSARNPIDLPFDILAEQFADFSIYEGNELNRLDNGQLRQASLTAGGAVAFPFTVQRPGEIVVSARRIAGISSTRTTLRLYGPDGSEVDFRSSQRSSSTTYDFLTHDATQTGEYVIVVTDEGNDQSIDFEIREVSISSPYVANPDDANPDLDIALVENGRSYSVSVPVGGFSLASFDRSATGATYLQSLADDLNQQAELILFDEAGNRVEPYRNDYLSVSAGTPERMTVVVLNAGASLGDDFMIRRFTTGESPVTLSDFDAVVENGQTATVDVSFRQFQFFQMTLDAPGSLWWSLPGAADVGSALTLVRPNGQRTDLRSFQQVPLEFGKIEALEAGTYTFVFQDGSDNLPLEPTTLSFTATWLSNGEESIAGVTPLIHRQPVSASFSPKGHRFFSFDIVEEDSLVVVDLVGTGGAVGAIHTLDLSVYDEAGQFVEDFDGGGGAGATLSLDAGRYYVVTANPTGELVEGQLEFMTPYARPTILTVDRDGENALFTPGLSRPDLLGEVSLRFDRDVDFSQFDIGLSNESEGYFYYIQSDAISYDASTLTATIDFSDLQQDLYPGFYTVVVPDYAVVSVESSRSLLNHFELPVPVALPGDTNLDGRVDVLADAASLVNNLGRTGDVSWSDGDMNGDNVVDVLNDAATLVENLGRSVNAPQAMAAARMIQVDDQSLGQSLGTPVLGTPTLIPSDLTKNNEPDSRSVGQPSASRELMATGQEDLRVLAGSLVLDTVFETI